VSESQSTRPDESDDAPGALLVAARREQNLSVTDVARQLKLTVHQVEALEAGEYEKLPGAVFVRGFIRNYARFVKLDPEHLVAAAAKRLPHQEPRPPAPPSQDIPFPTVAPRRWPKYAAAFGVAVAVLAAYEFFFNEPSTAIRRAPSAPAATVQPPNEPVAPEIAPEPTVPAGNTGPVAPIPITPQPAPQTDKRNALPATATIALRQSESPLADRQSEVRMVFEQESWVEIRDRSGKAIFSQLNRRGTEQRVNGRPPLSVIVGNAPGVRLTYDDKPVDLAPHTKIDVARFHLE
jgi:cytoskeleton protein RodZ